MSLCFEHTNLYQHCHFDPVSLTLGKFHSFTYTEWKDCLAISITKCFMILELKK